MTKACETKDCDFEIVTLQRFCDDCYALRIKSGSQNYNKEVKGHGWKNDKTETRLRRKKAEWRADNGYGDPADGNGYE